jgi:D-sedoheptulose 7-phosphate isomerase
MTTPTVAPTPRAEDWEARIAEMARASEEARRAFFAQATADVARAARLVAEAMRAGGKLLIFGNGGSAADAQHFAAELVNRFEMERPPLAAVALTTDTSNLTSIANDYAWQQVFSKQVLALGRRGDVLLAISTSGNSANVLDGIHAAHEIGVRVVALTGNGGGKMGAALRADDVHLCVPHKKTARIQEVHLVCIHCLCDSIDTLLFPR